MATRLAGEKKMCDLSKCVILSKNCVVLNWKSHDVVIMHFIFKTTTTMHFLALYTKRSKNNDLLESNVSPGDQIMVSK